MSVNDLRITEVMYNPAPGGFEYIEITNTGDTPVSAADFFVGNSDFMPEYYTLSGPDAAFAPMVPAGATIVLVPSAPDFSGEVFVPPVPVSQSDFEAAYGPLPAAAVYFNYSAFFLNSDGNGLPGGLSYTIGGVDIFADSVFIPDGAAPGQSVSLSLTDGTTTIGTPTPGSTGTAPPPPPPSGEEISGTNSSDVLAGTTGDDTIDGGSGNDEIDAGAGHDTVLGGKGKDSISGGDGDDMIDSGGQADLVYGGNGDDRIYGGLGNDSLFGDDGDDVIFGGSNNDIINGGRGNDTLYGDHGADTISGGSDDDEIYGGRSNDKLNGNSGNDSLFGGNGNDKLTGGTGDDYLDGGAQADRLDGGDGNDTLVGGLGNDELTGGAGADTFVFAGVVNNDVITDFEAGIDTIDFTAYGPFSVEDAIAIASDTPEGVLLDLYGNGSVLLEGVALSDLSLNDFNFILDDTLTVV